MKTLLLSTLLMVGCAGGQVLKGPDKQVPPVVVQQDETTEDYNHVYAFIIWASILGAGIYLFIRNERSPKK